MTKSAIAHQSALRHSGFGLLSSLVIRHWSFSFMLPIPLTALRSTLAQTQTHGIDAIVRFAYNRFP